MSPRISRKSVIHMMSGGDGFTGYDSITASMNFQAGGPQIFGFMSDLVDMVGGFLWSYYSGG